MAKQTGSERREFLRSSGLGLAATILGARFIFQTPPAGAQGAGGPAKVVMVKTSEPMAQTLGYYEDATKVDVKKWAKRKLPEGAKQFCYNCQFYQLKKDPEKSTAAPCTIFAGKGVTAKGWCNTWTQDPTIKT